MKGKEKELNMNCRGWGSRHRSRGGIKGSDATAHFTKDQLANED